MYLSFLYKEPEERIKTTSDLTELSIDRIVDFLSPKEAHYLVDMLSSPMQKVENVLYRQELCIFFINNTQYFDKTLMLFKIFFNTINDIQSKKNKSFNIQNKSRYDYSSFGLTGVFDNLIDCASDAMRILSFAEYISELFGDVIDKPHGISRICKYCDVIIKNEDYQNLKNILLNIASQKSETFTAKLIMKYDNLLKIYYTSISPFGINERHKEVKIESSFFWQKNKYIQLERDKVYLSNNDRTRNEISFLCKSAADNITNIINAITKAFITNFKDNYEELTFYKLAIKLSIMSIETNTPICFAQIVDHSQNILKIDELYDTFLTYKSWKNTGMRSVIPNDTELTADTDGIIILGDNNTGKTVYLCSVGTAFLFSACGLPIFAKSAQISLRSGFFTQFASAEEQFLIQNDMAGRFEGEVKELAKIFDDLKPHSLILFNETFQTTSQSEAVDSLFVILDTLTKLKIKWILVTHLRKLVNRFNEFDSGVIILETGLGENLYKLEKHKIDDKCY